MNRPTHEAEDQRGHEQPTAPQHQPGPDQVGPRCATRQPQPADQRDQCRRQQPGDLGAERVTEHPGDPRAPTEPGVRAATASATTVARATQQPPEPVVAKGKLQQRVVGRPTDVRRDSTRATVRTSATYQPAAHDHRAQRTEQMQQPLAETTSAPRSDTPARTPAAPGTPASSWSGTRTRSPPRPAPATAPTPCPSDRTTKYAAATISSTSNASGLLNRNISTATGVNASVVPAISRRPDRRRASP